MKTAIVYHTDIDGHLSGYILWKHLAKRDPIMIRMNYDDVFPWDLVDEDTEVWMADFSLQPWSDMNLLNNRCKNLVWIDHHKSAINEYNNWSKIEHKALAGARIDGTAACGLCWDYCFGTQRPLAVHLAERYDVWKWQDVVGAIEFQHGTKFYDTDPGTSKGRDFWDEVLESELYVEKIIEEGELLMEYKVRSNTDYMKDNAFETTIDGLSAIAVNKKGNAQQFDSIFNPQKHNVMLTFAWAKGLWTIGLYTTREDTDVSLIAKKFGGGGHKKAAGFQCKNLPFELK